MMSSAKSTRLILLLVVQQTLSYPAEPIEHGSLGYYYTNEFPLNPGNELGHLATEGSVTSLTSHRSELEPHSQSQTKGYWSDLFGSSGTTESQNSGVIEAEDQKQKPKAGHQSATIISASTYPVGAKPAKPGTDQGKPTGGTSQGPTVPVTPVVSPPAQSKPPGSPPGGGQNPYKPKPPTFPGPGAPLLGSSSFGSQKPSKPPTYPGSGGSLFGSSSFGNQKPNRPPVYPAFGSSLLSSSLYGQKPNKPPVSPTFGGSSFSPSFGSSSFGSFPSALATFPSFDTGFMQQSQAMTNFMPPPPNPFLFGSPFGGVESSFGGLGRPFGGLGMPFGGSGGPLGSSASFMKGIGGSTIPDGDKIDGLVLPSPVA